MDRTDITFRPTFFSGTASLTSTLLLTVRVTFLLSRDTVSCSGQADLDDRIQVVSLLHRHLKVMLWFVHNGLLPEHDGELPAFCVTNDGQWRFTVLHEQLDMCQLMLCAVRVVGWWYIDRFWIWQVFPPMSTGTKLSLFCVNRCKLTLYCSETPFLATVDHINRG